jgi:hypothetical protein
MGNMLYLVLLRNSIIFSFNHFDFPHFFLLEDLWACLTQKVIRENFVFLSTCNYFFIIQTTIFQI